MFSRRNNPRSFASWSAIALAAIALVPSLASAQANDIRVMSFNIRVGSANDGNNSWNHPTTGVDRKDLVVTTVKNYNPDILGLQEDLDYQSDYIRNNVDVEYSMFRRGAKADGTGEEVAILYRTDRFNRHRQGTFWLSPTPSTPGSEFDSAEFPRVVNWLELSDKRDPDFHFVVMNTHWEHGGQTAKDTVREKSAALMREKMTEIAPTLPILFTGDFNADEGDASYQRMTSRDNFVETPIDETRFLTDSYRNRHSDSESVGTAHGFDGTAGPGRIDWILHTDTGFNTIAADIDKSVFNGRYPSDHFPINATLRPVPVPEPAGAAIVGAFGALMASRRRRRANHWNAELS
jgi:endonuclease/exonuclease/phosphatase family metal-dependent hydrolase